MPIETLDETQAPAPTRKAISSFEKSLGIRLPEAFIDVLKSANAAVPKRREFPAGDDWRLIDRFLGLVDAPHALRVYDMRLALEDLVERLLTTEELEDEGEYRAKVLPVAVLFGGDHVCLDYRNDGEPTVRVWMHEESEEGAPVYVDVAPTFAAFLELLREAYIRKPTILDGLGIEGVSYRGPDRNQVLRPSRAFLEEVLHRGEDYWEPGCGASIEIERHGAKLGLGVFVHSEGVRLSHAEEGLPECFRVTSRECADDTVSIMRGSMRAVVSRRFFLTVEEAISVIEHFIAQGSADDGEWAALW
jgi:hypothetical protein